MLYLVYIVWELKKFLKLKGKKFKTDYSFDSSNIYTISLSKKLDQQ
jgi:hypothetical protein